MLFASVLVKLGQWLFDFFERGVLEMLVYFFTIETQLNRTRLLEPVQDRCEPLSVVCEWSTETGVSPVQWRSRS